jgi:hypothetical protein
VAIQVFGNAELAKAVEKFIPQLTEAYGIAEKQQFANRPLLTLQKENNPAYGLENVGGPGC